MIKFTAGRATDDPEKCVFPSMIIAFASHPNLEGHHHGRVRGFLLAVGWWDFYIRASWLKFKNTGKSTSPQPVNSDMGEK